MVLTVCVCVQPWQVWRINCLIRLYVGFLLFTLSDAMNPVKRTFTFEQWYMFYFHDLQLWERKKKVSKQSTGIPTNLVARLNDRVASNSLGSTLSGVDDPNSQVIEIASRVTELAQVGVCCQHCKNF